MVHTYRTLQQWDQWLSQFLGKELLNAESHVLQTLLEKKYGKYALLLGVPQQSILLRESLIPYLLLLSPRLHKVNSALKGIESEFYNLPIATGSIDLVLLPHTLEYMDNPRKLLNEACRVVKPEGHIIIVGFNPFSLWGMRKLFKHKKQVPWSSNFLQKSLVKKWLTLADFELTHQKMVSFGLPIEHVNLHRKLKFLDWLGKKLFFPFGDIYILIAEAKLIPLTPIKLSWKQQLPSLHLPTVPGSNI